MPGWGIDQMYLAYEKYRKIIEPDIIILDVRMPEMDGIETIEQARNYLKKLNRKETLISYFVIKN